jgi:ABC-type transport system involved in multi-copper enzyme maturation permease subunit
MYVFENPILQHELVVNLRKARGFILLFVYVGILGLLVYAAWPSDETLDLARPEKARALVNLFFFGQYALMTLMTPSFAAGAITGEKERESYEMLLASPLRPGAIVLGKLAASLAPLAELMIAALPIVMLCLPLGGVSLYDVLGAYVAMIASVGLSGMICLWASSYFTRTSAALVVSYLLILPLAMAGVVLWQSLSQVGQTRLWVLVLFVPAGCAAVSAMLWLDICRRLMKPPDLGAGGNQAIDLETEAREAIGLYIERDQFPDRLFAPPKRTTFLADDANPIYDKEIRSEIFAQGTLMLRLVIQVSMILALVVMAGCLFFSPWLAPWYVSYVLLFNMLVGPVFSAGSVTNERERATLDLLLTTLITPWQMMWGKLLSGLRVSSVLTSFLLWPLVLATIMPGLGFWSNLPTVLGYFLIVAVSAATTATTAMLCSTLARRTSTSLTASYVVLSALYLLPPATAVFVRIFAPGGRVAASLPWLSSLSPFSAAFQLPLAFSQAPAIRAGAPSAFFGYLGFTVVLNALMLLAVTRLIEARWRVME